jgi:hypothetical protein
MALSIQNELLDSLAPANENESGQQQADNYTAGIRRDVLQIEYATRPRSLRHIEGETKNEQQHGNDDVALTAIEP